MQPTTLSRFFLLALLPWSNLAGVPATAPLAPVAAASNASAPSDTRPGSGPFTSRPPYQAQRLALFNRRCDLDRHAVVFLGDSITEGWATMGQAFPKVRVANRGIASDTTRGMLGRLPEALTLTPQALVIAGGINDLRATNNPPGTPETVAGNLKLMLAAAQIHNPKLPVLVCEILPSAVATPEIIAQTNLAVDRVVAEFPQAVRVKSHARFLNPDGTQNRALFTDGVHLKPDGYALWQSILTPAFDKLGLKRVNTAVIPITQKGNGYDWMARHNAVLKLKSELNPDLVFIGDSITHHWGGLPNDKCKTGESVLKAAFAGHRILNLGFGSDRTQHALWRLDHGELSNLTPNWVVINIGTNNSSDGHSAEEIMAGIRAVCERVRQQTPNAKIILMAILPRDAAPSAPRRKLINTLNPMIANYAKANGFIHLDIGSKFLDAHGVIQKPLMPDFCHPTAQGYQFWADALTPVLTATK